jgi:hypothetical protein
MMAGFPKRAKRPIDEFPVSNNASLMTSSSLASMSTDERDKLLQMLEQESNVSMTSIDMIIELSITFRLTNSMKIH